MTLKAERLFDLMTPFLAEKGKDLVPKIKAVYQFSVITKKGGPVVQTWTIDLKNGNGSIKKGAEGTPDCVFTVLDDDVIAMANKTLNPQQAFMSGKMKIKGNMAAATKFTPDLLPSMPKL